MSDSGLQKEIVFWTEIMFIDSDRNEDPGYYQWMLMSSIDRTGDHSVNLHARSFPYRTMDECVHSAKFMCDRLKIEFTPPSSDEIF